MFDLPLESPAPVVDGSADDPKTASIHQAMDAKKSLKAPFNFFTKNPDVVIATLYTLFTFCSHLSFLSSKALWLSEFCFIF